LRVFFIRRSSCQKERNANAERVRSVAIDIDKRFQELKKQKKKKLPSRKQIRREIRTGK